MKKFMSILSLISLVHSNALFEMDDEKEELTIPESFPVDDLMDLSTLEGLPKSIIIIGAGASGIQTAHTLIKKGYKNKITIVEAYNEAGGRMRNADFQGQKVELGANWVTGTEKKHKKSGLEVNPAWKLAKECNLKGYVEKENSNSQKAYYKGKDVTEKYEDADDTFWSIWKKAMKYAKKSEDQEHDMSERDLLKKFGWKKPTTPMNKLIEWMYIDEEDAQYAGNSSSAANADDPTYDHYGDKEYWVQDPRGFKYILHGMIEDLKAAGNVEFQYNHDIHSVNYTPGEVSVSGKTTAGAAFNYEADAVVSTVSIGVLNDKIIDFKPEFPAWKTKAFSQITMGLENKVFVAIPKTAKWVPTAEHFAIPSDNQDYYPNWRNWAQTDTHYIMMTFAVMDEGIRLERASKETIINEVEQVFKNAFTKPGEEDNSGQFRPDDAMVAQWWDDKHFRGSYSFWPTSAMANIPQHELTDALTGTGSQTGAKTLYFSGEALDYEMSAYVHGALRSGVFTANQIIKESQALVQETLH